MFLQSESPQIQNLELFYIKLAESTRIHGYKKLLKGKKLAYIKSKKKLENFQFFFIG